LIFALVTSFEATHRQSGRDGEDLSRVVVLNNDRMSWQVHAVRLPDGDDVEDFWVDRSGSLVRTAVAGAELLPGGYACHGLVDAHAHPSVAIGPVGPVARDLAGAAATLVEWARAGVTMVRDVGSPAGLTLSLERGPGLPSVQAAGRFLAPTGQYFPELLPDGVPEDQLTLIALAEVARGARWVKVIADFPKVAGGVPSGPALPTYELAAIADLVTAVHAAGARVAVHSTTGSVVDLVSAGVDSIEHGTSIDESALRLMARTGAAWTPTLCAVLDSPDDDLPAERRQQRAEYRDRLSTLLPAAVKLGVPVLTGSDGVGTVAREVMLLARHGLGSSEALAAATTSAYRFLDDDLARAGTPTSLVTYDADPREDPAVLAEPRAVLINGQRIR
jgi:imidazolonepropionase-like amidohydrolase